jgi:hypothetical protein
MSASAPPSWHIVILHYTETAAYNRFQIEVASISNPWETQVLELIADS